MNSCIAAARMTMTADVFKQERVVNPSTNAVERRWVYHKNIKCVAYPYTDGGRYNFGVQEKFGSVEHIKEDFIRMRTLERLSDSWRVANIRSSSGNLIWVEDDGQSIFYNVDGSAPLPAPLSGIVTEYISALSRADVVGS